MRVEKLSSLKLGLLQLDQETIAPLVTDPKAEAKDSIEIQATFPDGAQDQIKRAESDDTKNLGFPIADWESSRTSLWSFTLLDKKKL